MSRVTNIVSAALGFGAAVVLLAATAATDVYGTLDVPAARRLLTRLGDPEAPR
jgi:hypothetical protein